MTVQNSGKMSCAYAYDDIGNCTASSEAGVSRTYAANPLNQYVGSDYDLDGNQTNVTTRTGVWSVVYNGENRPILWTSRTTNIVMKYDHMGRRVEYAECDGSVTNKHQKFVYDGYLCIQRLNGSDNDITELFEWDPTEPVATRPLFMQTRESGQNFKNYFYAHDGNKNVTDVISYQAATGAVAHYNYTPFGRVNSQIAAMAGVDNPLQFSSEYYDRALVLNYFNHRQYSPECGRWLSRDDIFEYAGNNLFSFCDNDGVNRVDVGGRNWIAVAIAVGVTAYSVWTVASSSEATMRSANINDISAVAKKGLCVARDTTITVMATSPGTPSLTSTIFDKIKEQFLKYLYRKHCEPCKKDEPIWGEIRPLTE